MWWKVFLWLVRLEGGQGFSSRVGTAQKNIVIISPSGGGIGEISAISSVKENNKVYWLVAGGSDVKLTSEIVEKYYDTGLLKIAGISSSNDNVVETISDWGKKVDGLVCTTDGSEECE